MGVVAEKTAADSPEQASGKQGTRPQAAEHGVAGPQTTGGPAAGDKAPGAAEKAAAGDKAGSDKTSAPHDKRRALGRGLESLLPSGPRMVAGTAAVPRPVVVAPQAPPQASPEAGPQESVEAGSQPAPQTVAQSAPPASSHAASHVTSQATSQAMPAFPPPGSFSAGETEAPQPGVVAQLHAAASPRSDGTEVVRLRLDQIDKNPYQTRTWMPEAELTQMAESIRTNGVIQPIVVRPAETEGRYTLIMGERRWRASEVANKQTIPAIVRLVSDQQAAEMTLIENLQRQDISCMDQARAFMTMGTTFKLTQEEIGLRVGVSRETVANYQRLTRLPKEVQHLLLTRQLDFSRARLLLRLPENPELRIRVALHAVKKDMSVTALERLLDRAFKDAREEIARGTARVVDPNVRAAQRELERALGLKVKIRDRGGKGRIEIEYGSIDDYERVVELLRAAKKK